MERQAVGLLSALLLASICSGTRATELPQGLLTDDPVWTDKPVRIDRGKQTYERIAVERLAVPLRISISARVAVFDSASFQDGGPVYVVTGAVPVDPRRLCRSSDDSVSVCGQQARQYLKRLVSNRTLICGEDFRMAGVSFVSCTVDGKDLAETLIARGTAWAATSGMRSTQEDAMQQGLGIWADTECHALRRCPPERKRTTEPVD